MKQRSRRFYPPTLNPVLVWGLQNVAPWIAHTLYRLDLVISSEPGVQVSELKGKTCVLLCNHPTFDDSIAMFLLSAYLEEPFYYLSAYEQFLDWKGWFYQSIGAYSVQRGLADRDSIAHTLELLTQPDRKLVIFPEGGCSFQNDTVMPFRPGAIQIGMQALSRCTKRGEPVPDLYAIPISLKYRYIGKMTPVIDKVLQNLERSLHLSPETDYYQRLRRVAEQVLARFEQDYALTPQTSDWNQRIVTLKAQVLQRYEQVLGLSSAPGEPDRERVYRMRHALEQRQKPLLEDELGEKLGEKLDNEIKNWEVMSKALTRILNFDAIYDGYVAEKPTPERFLDTLIRLEREVFGIDKPRPKGHRHALLRIGKPVRLNDYLEDYGKNRSVTITALTQQLQHTVQRNLDLLSESTARDISW